MPAAPALSPFLLLAGGTRLGLGGGSQPLLRLLVLPPMDFLGDYRSVSY